MATGDQSDFQKRISDSLPRGWFSGDALPIISAVIAGLSSAWAGLYGLYAYALLQARILTATGGWLDLIAADYFGAALMRADGQSDASFRARIIINLFRERGTRPSLVQVLTDLTGRAPVVFEPLRPADTGAYGVSQSIGYGMAGGYGSMLIPFQCFVTAYRPAGSGIPLVAGYGVPTGAYRTPSRSDYASLDSIQGSITDADIYDAVASVMPTATIAWTQIK